MICCVATNSLKITLILQPARSDVKIGRYRAHGNRLYGEYDRKRFKIQKLVSKFIACEKLIFEFQ